MADKIALRIAEEIDFARKFKLERVALSFTPSIPNDRRSIISGPVQTNKRVLIHWRNEGTSKEAMIIELNPSKIDLKPRRLQRRGALKRK